MDISGRSNSSTTGCSVPEKVTQVNFTATILMHIFPSSPIHPYIGGSIGIGRMSIFAEGTYQDELGTTIRESFLKKN